eukprot:765909-Hanusia_phi.AAC.2
MPGNNLSQPLAPYDKAQQTCGTPAEAVLPTTPPCFKSSISPHPTSPHQSTLASPVAFQTDYPQAKIYHPPIPGTVDVRQHPPLPPHITYLCITQRHLLPPHPNYVTLGIVTHPRLTDCDNPTPGRGRTTPHLLCYFTGSNLQLADPRDYSTSKPS